jgi:hypothetical protein
MTTPRSCAPICLLLEAVGALFLAGCSNDGGSLTEPTTGTVTVTTATTGPAPDPDGYTASVDSGTAQALAPEAIGLNATITITGVAAGSHTVRLGGLASTCTITGDNPRPAVVQAAETTRVAFAVACGTGGGGAPTITAVNGPDTADNAPGTSADFRVGFSDPDGDVARLTVVAASDPANAVEPDSVEVDTRAQMQGRTSGEIAYRITCAATSPNLCGAGPVTLRFQLTDAAGNRSEPKTFDLRYGIGNSPAITSVDAPARTSTARGTRTRVRLAFSDPDGDLRKVRLDEVSDTNDVVNATGEADVSAEAGTQTSGTVVVDFICQSPPGKVCPSGTAVLRFVLVDAESNTSAPRDVTILFEPSTGGGTPPTITTFQIPATISTAAGTRADFVVGFGDPDGDVTTLRIEEVSDPSAAFPGNLDLDILALADGRDTGTVRETLVCNLPPGQQCPAGRVTLRFTLLDAAGNGSAPREATVEFVAPAASSGAVAGAAPVIGGAFTVVAREVSANEKAPEARLRRLSPR